MELVRVKLNTLLELAALRETDLARLPPAARSPARSPTSLARTVSETIQLLAYLTLRSREGLLENDSPALQLHCSREELTRLDTVKRDLEDMRYRLASPTLDQRTVLPEIRAELKAMIKICLPFTGNPEGRSERELGRHRFGSATGELGGRRESEAERAARVKVELAREMDQHLQTRRPSSNQSPFYDTTP